MNLDNNIASSLRQLPSFQVFDGIGSSSSEVHVEQGSAGSMGRRKRRSMTTKVSGHVSASHEQVLTRHLLAFKDGNKHSKESDELEDSQLQDSLNMWSRCVSILTVLAAMVVVALLILSVVLWFRRRQESSLPC